jgi:chaperonin cofactor prefoldin
LLKVKNLKFAVYKEYKQKLEDFEIKIRELKEDQVIIKSKVYSLESNLP